MVHVFSSIEAFLQVLSVAVPLPVFVFVGSFIEEVVSPIPSALVMGLAGSASAANHHPIPYLFLLSFVGNFGKVLGAWVYYVVGDRLEHVAVRRFGRYFGVRQSQIEAIGRKFTGSWKDSLLLFFMRLLPFIPTTPVSLTCGAIHMRRAEFLAITYAANFIKDLAYLFSGYYGLVALRKFFRHLAAFHSHVSVLILVVTIVGLFLLYYHRKKGVWLWQWCRNNIKIKMSKFKSNPNLK